MKSALQKFLPHIENGEENIFTFAFLKNILSEGEIGSLEEKKVLIRMRDLEYVPCGSCFSGEFENVKVNGEGKIYYTCSSDGSRQYVDSKILKQWKVDSAHLPKKDLTIAKRLIEKNTHGNFLFDGRIISMPETAEYRILFDILFTHSGQDGFLSYEAIEKHLVKRHLKPFENIEKRNKRIQNYIEQGIFRYAKISDKVLTNEIPDGQPLIKMRRGQGVIFNNPSS